MIFQYYNIFFQNITIDPIFITPPPLQFFFNCICRELPQSFSKIPFGLPVMQVNWCLPHLKHTTYTNAYCLKNSCICNTVVINRDRGMSGIETRFPMHLQYLWNIFPQHSCDAEGFWKTLPSALIEQSQLFVRAFHLIHALIIPLWYIPTALLWRQGCLENTTSNPVNTIYCL